MGREDAAPQPLPGTLSPQFTLGGALPARTLPHHSHQCLPASSDPQGQSGCSVKPVSWASAEMSRWLAFVRDPGKERPSRLSDTAEPRWKQPLLAPRHVGHCFHFRGAAPASACTRWGDGAGEQVAGGRRGLLGNRTPNNRRWAGTLQGAAADRGRGPVPPGSRGHSQAAALAGDAAGRRGRGHTLRGPLP